MNTYLHYINRSSVILALFLCVLSCSKEPYVTLPETVKVSLRDVGHQMLLSYQDSTSLVLPIKALDESTYTLPFDYSFSMEPAVLVRTIQGSFEKASLPEHYLVEVIQCEDGAVAYSYEMKYNEEKAIIPCGGRFLPEACYKIEVKFIDEKKTFFGAKPYLYTLIILVFFILLFFFYKRNQSQRLKEINKNYNTIGRYKFYPEQNKLVTEAIEISLSKKECELLSLLIAKPNEIIKRDELTKKVWEDHGVIVGRSLDTYISKLRKKLQDDTSIKITNVHGVGYKLEIQNPN